MSRSEWEQGTFRIPANQWVKIKSALRFAYNQGLEADFVLAEQVLTKVKADYKGRRNVNWRSVLTQELDAEDPRSHGGGAFRPKYRFAVLSSTAIIAKACAALTAGRGKLRSLKKKDFPPATNKTMVFDADAGKISLNEQDRTVVWDVPEGNWACDRARESHMGRVLFRTLECLAWTRQSGGFIVGNDENHRMANPGEVGGGGHRFKLPFFGPIGKEQAKLRGQHVSR